MKYFRRIIPLGILTIVAIVFYYKFFFFGLIPFPGDLLLSSYKPWRTYSYLGYNPGSTPTKDQYFDVLQQMYPWRTFTTASLKTGKLPLWNPYNFSGHPMLANHQSAVLYPPNMVYLLLPQHIAFAILVIFQHLFTSIGMYLYLKKIGISRGPAIFGSIAFTYGLFLSAIDQYVTIGHTILWLPFMLWSIESIHAKTRMKTAMCTLYISTFCVMTAGHLQTAGAVLATTIIYAVLRSIWDRSGQLLTNTTLYRTIGIVLLGVGSANIQLIPTLELLHYSARVPLDIASLLSRLLIQPHQLVQLLIPDIFGNPATRNYLIDDTYATNAIAIGIAPLLFCLMGMTGTKHIHVRIALFFLAGIGLITIRTPISEIFYKLPIPFLSSSSPSNILFLLTFFLAALASFGMHAFTIEHAHRFTPLKTTIGILCVAGLFIVIAKFFHLPMSYKNIIFSGSIFVATLGLFALVKVLKRQHILFFCTLLTIGELLYFHAKFNPFVPKEMIYPDAPIITWLSSHKNNGRIWGYGSAGISANIHTHLGLSSPEGYDPLYPKWYGEFLYASQTGKLLEAFTNRTRSDATILSDGFDHDSIPKRYTEKILRITGVSYILDRAENGSTEDAFPGDTYTSVYQENDWNILENKKAIDRVTLIPSYTYTTAKDEFEEQFFSDKFDPSTSVILDQPPKTSCCDATEWSITHQEFFDNEINIITKTNGSMILYLADTYYPGWRAYIDERESPIYRANYAFRAIVVPAGTHAIKFHYQPFSLVIGVWLSLASACLFLYILSRPVPDGTS